MKARGRLNLLLVTNLYPTPADPTRGIFVFQLYRALAAYCDVTVVCPLPWFPRLPVRKLPERWLKLAAVPRRYSVGGFTVYSPKYPLLPRVSEGIHALLMRAALSGSIRRLHERAPFDVVNAQWLYPDGVACAEACARLNVPLVLSALGSDVNVFASQKRIWPQIAKSIGRAAAVTVVSEALKQRLLAASVPAERIVTIPNGADTQLFHPRPRQECRRALNLDPGIKVILFVGRLVAIKGVNFLIEAAASLAARRRDFVICLLGEGPLRSAYEAQVAANRLTGHVRFLGNRPHAEVPVWLGAADVLCLPSLEEGCPNVVLEALSCGRPVVASRTGGIPEMVDSRNGMLPPPGDSPALAEALAATLERAWSESAIRETVEHLTWESAARRYYAVFAAASGERQR